MAPAGPKVCVGAILLPITSDSRFWLGWLRNGKKMARAKHAVGNIISCGHRGIHIVADVSPYMFPLNDIRISIVTATASMPALTSLYTPVHDFERDPPEG